MARRVRFENALARYLVKEGSEEGEKEKKLIAETHFDLDPSILLIFSIWLTFCWMGLISSHLDGVVLRFFNVLTKSQGGEDEGESKDGNGPDSDYERMLARDFQYREELKEKIIPMPCLSVSADAMIRLGTPRKSS
jgi:hypothetical protein